MQPVCGAGVILTPRRQMVASFQGPSFCSVKPHSWWFSSNPHMCPRGMLCPWRLLAWLLPLAEGQECSTLRDFLFFSCFNVTALEIRAELHQHVVSRRYQLMFTSHFSALCCHFQAMSQ